MFRSLAFAAFLAVGSISTALAVMPNTPEAAVKSFYGAKNAPDTQLSASITPRFYALLMAADRYQAMCWCADVLDASPFIRGQMAPRTFTLGKAAFSGDTAVVPMTQYYRKPRVLDVHLHKVAGKWLIADVTEGSQSSLAELAASVKRAYAPGRTPSASANLLYFWASGAREHGGFWANLALPKYFMTPVLYGLFTRAEERRKATHGVVLDYDPFSNAQIVMTGYHLAKPIVNGATAAIMVRVDHKNAASSHVKVMLRRVVGGWLVDDIVGSESGSLKQNLEAALK